MLNSSMEMNISVFFKAETSTCRLHFATAGLSQSSMCQIISGLRQQISVHFQESLKPGFLYVTRDSSSRTTLMHIVVRM